MSGRGKEVFLRIQFRILIGMCLVGLLAGAALAQTPATPAPAAAKPAPEKREGIEDMFSLGVFFWMPDHGRPGFRPGPFIPDPTTATFDLTEKPFRANGAMLTFPTGGLNRLEISYWRMNDSGDLRAPNKLNLFGASIANNERLNTRYKITNMRAAWNYLSFPVPVYDAKLRLKSFWEVQYTQIKPTVGFPEAKNNPAPIQPNQAVILPGVGLGIEYVPTRAFRLEARGSGMGFPQRSGYFDLEGTAVLRVSKVELFGGMKAFHFQTSRKKEEIFIQGTMWGPMFGARWVFR
jgi:hypothetical protein